MGFDSILMKLSGCWKHLHSESDEKLTDVIHTRINTLCSQDVWYKQTWETFCWLGKYCENGIWLEKFFLILIDKEEGSKQLSVLKMFTAQHSSYIGSTSSLDLFIP